MGEEEGNAFTILSGKWTLSNTPQPPHESHTGGIFFCLLVGCGDTQAWWWV
jgi:hypothetical protein